MFVRIWKSGYVLIIENKQVEELQSISTDIGRI